jgi:hypothetical protein
MSRHDIVSFRLVVMILSPLNLCGEMNHCRFVAPVNTRRPVLPHMPDVVAWVGFVDPAAPSVMCSVGVGISDHDPHRPGYLSIKASP